MRRLWSTQCFLGEQRKATQVHQVIVIKLFGWLVAVVNCNRGSTTIVRFGATQLTSGLNVFSEHLLFVDKLRVVEEPRLLAVRRRILISAAQGSSFRTIRQKDVTRNYRPGLQNLFVDASSQATVFRDRWPLNWSSHHGLRVFAGALHWCLRPNGRALDPFRLSRHVFLGGIVRTNFLVIPVPYVVEEAPNNISIPLYHLILWPEVPRTKLWIGFEIAHDFREVGLDLRHVASPGRISIYPFNCFVFAV